MAIVNTTTNLNSVTYALGELITLDGGPDKVLTINSTPPRAIGNLSCITSGKIRIENTSTTTPIVITFNSPSNRFNVKSAGIVEIIGDWITVATGDNTSNQVLFNASNINGVNIDFPSFIEVETGSNTNVFIPYFLAVTSMGGNLGNIYFFNTTDFGSNYLGRVLFYNPTTQIVTCGNGTNGNRIPVGARVRIPNIHITGLPITTTLTAAVPTGATTTLTVASAASFATSGEVQIGSERWSYTGKTTTTLTGCVRSLYGTIAASYSSGEVVRQILSHVSIAQFDTNSSGSVTIDKCSFGNGFSTRFTNAGNLDLKNVGAVGTISLLSTIGTGKLTRCVSQPFTKNDIAGNSGISMISCNGPGYYSDLYSLAIGISAVIYSIFHQSSNTKSIGDLHGWLHRRAGFPLSSATGSRSLYLYGFGDISIDNLYVIGSFLTLGQSQRARIKNVYISDTLNGINQTTWTTQPIATAGVFNSSINNIQIIGSSPRGSLIFTDSTSSGLLFNNKNSPNVNLGNNSIGLINDAAKNTVVSHFSITNQRDRPFISSGSIGSILREINFVFSGSTSTDGIGYGTGYRLDQVGGLRRRYDTNNGALDYSPFAVLSNGSTGALACGLFGGQSEKSIYQITGTAYLNNTGGIILPTIGDSIIATNIDAPLFALTGFTGSIEYQGTTPTTGITYEFSMRAWGGSTWGSWQSLSIANLNSELALIPNYNPDEVGLDFRLRMTATTASTTRIINEIVLPATISTTYNPAVWKIDASLFAPIGANYLISNGVKTLSSGTIVTSPQVLELPSDFDGTIYDISVGVRKPGLIPGTVSSSYDYNPIDIRVALEIDNAYTAENVTGIAFNKTSKTITISETVSVSNIYDRISQWLSDLENFDVASFATSSGGTLLLTNQWNISITSTGLINPGSNANKVITNGLLSIQSGGTYLIEITDSNRTYYPPVNFSGFPSVANSNGKLPESVLGIKNQTTGIWTTYDVSSGSINVNLSELGSTGQLLTLVADAKGYYRTPEVKDVPLSSNGFDFSNLFEKITDSEGNEIYGLGVQSESDKITYNATDATFELGEGVISFYSALDRKEILTSSQSALTTMDTDIIRSMRFVKNAYANTVLLPSPLRITANSSATSSPILTDFTIVRLGDPTIDPYIHSARPEVQVRMSKLLVDPKSLTNLALIPALL